MIYYILYYIFYKIIASFIYYSNIICNFFRKEESGYFNSFIRITHNKINYNNKFHSIQPDGIKKLVIVAHPDDEVLWFGDFLIMNRSIEDNIKVVCITNASNKIRAAEFINVMDYLNISYEMWDYIDSKKYTGSKELEKELLHLCSKYDIIYTHSSTGETGHPQHIMLHNYIRLIAKEKLYIFSPKRELKMKNKLSSKKEHLLKLYSSQKDVLNYHNYLSAHEDHIKFEI